MRGGIRALSMVAAVAALAALAGCARPLGVPRGAELVWYGKPAGPDAFRDLAWERAGQLYVVDDKSGRVKAVRTVWPAKPNFSFTIRRDRAYRLYFREDPNFRAPATNRAT